MIGVFDSGYGGLTILHGLLEQLPQYSYMYLGDNARAPYGARSHDEILKFTTEGVERLFEQGCTLVILGCNTASANALRAIQEQLLPEKYPDKKVLGILVPTVEQITGVPWKRIETLELLNRRPLTTVGVLATEQTVASGAYEHEIHKRSESINVVQQACPELAPLIERGATDEELATKAEEYVQALLNNAAQPPLQAVLLGCTHYAIIAGHIAQLLPEHVPLYEQPKIVAKSLEQYLKKHTKLEQRLDRVGKSVFLTTGDPAAVSTHSERFFGQPIQFTAAELFSEPPKHILDRK